MPKVGARASVRWVLIGGLAVATAVAALTLRGRRPRLDDVPPLGPSAVTLVPGVHLLGALDPSAAYAVETADGLVLVDSGLEADAGPVKSQLARLRLDWRRVRAVLLTHLHGDHCGGAEHLRVATGAQVYAGRGDAPTLRAGAPRAAFFSVFPMPGHEPHPTTVDVELAGGETLDLGGARFRALATPGHTAGSICYLLEKDGLRILFAGDVITRLVGNGAADPWGRGGPLGTYTAYLSPRYHGDADAFLASLRALRAMPVPDLVLPGHPRSDPTPQDPRLSQARWESVLDDGIRAMETLADRYRADGPDFLDGEPKSLLPDLDYLGDFRGSAVYGLFAGGRLLLVAPRGGPGLPEFVSERLGRLGREPRAPDTVLLTSCDPPALAGLAALLDRSPARVVAPAGGVDAVRAACPRGTEVLPSEGLAAAGWPDITPLPLRGRGLHPTAYLARRGGKAVLLSDRIPILSDPDAVERLTADLSSSRDDAIEYLGSIHTLEGLAPDLWLPSIPSEGQNANLYDDQWAEIIAENYRLAAERLRQR
jgi:glyoxylase-like metal-dependent hydrolase (beta-lactamase superfamily II)